MDNRHAVRELFSQTSQSIYPLARGVMQPLFEEYFSEQRFYVPTIVASQVAPKPISVALLGKRTPYQNPKTVKNTLVAAAEAGYLKSEGKGSYVVSEKGAQIIKDIHLAFYKQINKIDQFPSEKMKAVASLLSKLIDGCTKSNLDAGTICLDISHNGHPEVEADSLAKIDQHLDDLNAFRDDAHIAAWQPVGVNGLTWEALTFVWGGEDNTAAKLAERLPYRDYSVEDYAQALTELKKLGWIEKTGDIFIITTAGKNLREQVEAATDRNYYANWKVLSTTDLSRLIELLTSLSETNIAILKTMPNE
jgi:ribosomal protein S19E (S16A)